MALATVAFALIHSALASRAAKRAAAAVAGERRAHAAYRLFYVGQSLLTFSLLLAYGRRLPAQTLYRRSGVPFFWPRPPALQHAQRGAGHGC
jgi:hypothetical protein